jgi:hypothetical protein
MGQLLRYTRIDELPQIIILARGEVRLIRSREPRCFRFSVSPRRGCPIETGWSMNPMAQQLVAALQNSSIKSRLQ